MDPKSLIGPISPIGYPTPFWFIELFKVLGFSLHMVPMNIWYAGSIIAALFGVFGRGNARIVGYHVARSLPFMLAFGINFGIIPLLFTQVAYYQFFYPATILMAWPWFAVFWMVMAAYFFTYLYRLAIRGGVAAEVASVGKTKHAQKETGGWLDWSGKTAIWLAAGIFVIIGFIFANAFSLMTHVGGWWSIFSKANTAGAATGLAINWNDTTLIPRWLFMFTLAMTTTGAFISIDGAFLSGRESEDYRRYASRFSFWLYTLGLIGFIIFGSWYLFGNRMWAVTEMMAQPIMRILFPLGAVSPGLPWLILLIQRNRPSRQLAAYAGVAQFGVVVLNAVSRQWLQNRELVAVTNIARHPVNPQYGAMILFLALFVGGLGLVGWMIAKIVEVNRKEFAESKK